MHYVSHCVSSTGWLSKCPQKPQKPEVLQTWNSIRVYHTIGREPKTWTITHCLPENTLAGSWKWKQSQNMNPDTLRKVVAISTYSLTTVSNIHPHEYFWTLSICHVPFRTLIISLYKMLTLYTMLTLSHLAILVSVLLGWDHSACDRMFLFSLIMTSNCNKDSVNLGIPKEKTLSISFQRKDENRIGYSEREITSIWP